MKKYKLLRIGHCYINRRGDFVIGILRGNKNRGYKMRASHAHPNVFLGEIQSLSRIVPNDGNWIEITPDEFKAVSAFHSSGYRVEFPAPKSGKLPTLIKF